MKLEIIFGSYSIQVIYLAHYSYCVVDPHRRELMYFDNVQPLVTFETEFMMTPPMQRKTKQVLLLYSCSKPL